MKKSLISCLMFSALAVSAYGDFNPSTFPLVFVPSLVSDATGNNAATTLLNDEAAAIAMVIDLGDPVMEAFDVTEFIVTAVIPTTKTINVSYTIISPYGINIGLKGIPGLSNKNSVSITASKIAAAGSTSLSPDHWGIGGILTGPDGKYIAETMLWSNFGPGGSLQKFINTASRTQFNIPNFLSVDLSLGAYESKSQYMMTGVHFKAFTTSDIEYSFIIGYKSNDQLAIDQNAQWIVYGDGLFLKTSNGNLIPPGRVTGFNPETPFTAQVISTGTATTTTFPNYLAVVINLPKKIPSTKSFAVSSNTTLESPKTVAFHLVGGNPQVALKYTLEPIKIDNIPAVSSIVYPASGNWTFGGRLIDARGYAIGTLLISNIDTSPSNSNSIIDDYSNQAGTNYNYGSVTFNSFVPGKPVIYYAFAPQNGYDYNVNFKNIINGVINFDVTLTSAVPTLTPITGVVIAISDSNNPVITFLLDDSYKKYGINNILNYTVPNPTLRSSWIIGGEMVDYTGNDIGSLIVSKGTLGTLESKQSNQQLIDIDGNQIHVSYTPSNASGSIGVQYEIAGGVLYLNLEVTP